MNQPLINNKEIHISEQHGHKSKLRNKLENKIKRLFIKESIRSFQEHTKGHMHDSYDHRYLHFQAVDIVEIVGSHSPHWIDSNTIYTLWVVISRDNFILDSISEIIT